ncbi:MarR family winged helix-turn-helix transcriptional regulator [Desulfosoma caldarium]|uniref:MarR family transcriptional regulator n=1 Tax=Desulfosoma caldarium TaxID=610254 RepID=A0A3N1UHI3_9BACT|nr:MarR family transcriptional regulator [Desulfosoma caldarium]ROQ89573.1 MarR family transcriptional regulator [Desulfosoma caldarium]
MLLQDCLCFQLASLSRSMARHYRERITPYGLTHTQFFMLLALYEEEGATLSVLAEKTHLDRPTVTGLIDRLERDGWAVRQADPQDRRSFRVYLTPKAKEHREVLLRIYHEVNGRLLEQLGVEEWKRFRTLLERLGFGDDEESSTPL